MGTPSPETRLTHRYPQGGSSAWDDVVVPRAVILSLAVSLLSAACALVEQPPPPGTRMFQAEVRNRSPRPLELLVQNSQTEGALPGAVRPLSVPPESTAIVTFFVPVSGEWAILIDPRTAVRNDDIEMLMEQGCTMIYIETAGDGGYGSGCK